MLKKFFKKTPKEFVENNRNPAVESMKKVIDEKRKDDPLIGAKIGSKDLVQRLIEVMTTEKGVHIESLLIALSSAAGYSCQASVREELISKGGKSENEVFNIVNSASGEKYYFGDSLNKPLAEDQYSIWSLAAGAADQLGEKELIDVGEIFAYVSETVGTEKFGIPRIPEGHTSAEKPIEIVKNLYPNLVPLLNDYCKAPSEWPILFGLAIQEVLLMSKGVIKPNLALAIVMECAIPMSKIDANDV